MSDSTNQATRRGLTIVSVPWGNQETSIEISIKKWEQIKAGKKLILSTRDEYDGETFRMKWHFNSHPQYSLVVTYGGEGATAFNGRIENAQIEESDV